MSLSTHRHPGLSKDDGSLRVYLSKDPWFDAHHERVSACSSATVVALVIWRMKRYYADARVDDLRWMLDPTTRLVTAVTGVTFEWTPGEGYLSRERLFLIAKVCAGINFMIAAFGMAVWMLRRRAASGASAAGVLVLAAAAAYSAAIVVNAARITFAVWMAAQPGQVLWMTAAQAHRVEGIAFYFGGLVVLYELVQRLDRRVDQQLTTPLMWYYAVTIAIPLANGAVGNSAGFIEHSLFVLLLPLLFVALATGSAAIMYAVHPRPERCTYPEPPSCASSPPPALRAVRLRWGRHHHLRSLRHR